MLKFFLYVCTLVPCLTFITLLQVSTVQAKAEIEWEIEQVEPPTNVSVEILSGTTAKFTWNPPSSNRFSRFSVQIIPLYSDSEIYHRQLEDTTELVLNTFLVPGGTYQIKVFAEYQSQISTEYASANFTTIPNPPARFIVWYRNETSLLVYWKEPPGILDSYKLRIQLNESVHSDFSITKEEYESGKKQPIFTGLVPGREYTLSVFSVSANSVSQPTMADYRTIPSAPRNLTIDPDSLTSSSFIAEWIPPGRGEFDRYTISVNGFKQVRTIPKDSAPRVVISNDKFQAGMTYTLAVKSVSGKVASWPTTINVTLPSDSISY